MMKLKRVLGACLAFTLATFMPAAFTAFDPVNDDSDIFLANPSFNAQRPNVLIIMDNTANWNTPFAAEKTALVNAVNGLSDQFNVGLMMFTETGSGNSTPDGGYVKFAIRQLTTANKAALAAMVSGLDSTADKSNGGKASLAMYEAFQYFGGTTAYAGANKVKRDYNGNASNTAGSLAGNALPNSTATTYLSPITDGCQKNFIIYISNGPAQDNSTDLTVSENKLKALNGGTTPSTITLNPNGSQDNWADEWARYMAVADCNTNIAGVQNVITYTLDVGPAGASSGQGPGWTALLKSMATNGKGKYFAINNSDANTASSIASALNTIFSEVQAVNSVFASTTLPVSVNVRGTNLNQVYIGVFRPDAAKNPRWLGNLKMYKLAVDSATSTVFLADSTGAAAENSTTGFISNTATSFWTTDSCFWSYLGADPNSTAAVPSSCIVPTSYPYWSDKPDGDKVEKGGAAQRLRTNYPTSQGTRKVYTCTAASGAICANGATLSATPFSAGASGYPADNANVTAADVGAYTTYSVSNINTVPINASTSTATVTLSGTLPSPYFSNGNTVRIEGASPAVFNGDYVISNVNSGAGTFDFVLPAVLSGTTAVATLANHIINTGDLVYVLGATPAAYDVAYAPATRISANSFSYQLGSVASTAVTNSPTFWSIKYPTTITGTGTTATVTLANHGYGANGTVITNAWITGASPSEFNLSSGSITVVNANTLTYTTSSAISGSGNTAKITTTASHLLKIGDLITISGGTNTPGSYNCTDCAVTSVIDANNFTYTPASMPTAAATGTLNLAVKRVFSNLTVTNGTSNSTKSDITATAPSGTTLDVDTTNWTVTVAGATPTGFNASGRTLTSVPSTTVANFTVSGGPNDSSTASGATVTFNRTTLTTGISINPVVTATGTPLAWKLIAPTSIAAQTSATGTITAGRPTDADATKRASIINWVLGRDNAEGEAPPGTSPAASTDTDVRPSVHGDVLHSRPAVVNYNRYGNDNDIYAFYGANDGMLRALKGGLASDETGISPGDERWSFIPREFFSKFKRLRNNTPAISSSIPRDYLGDGPIGAYTLDAFKVDGSAGSDGILSPANGDKVHLFYAFRRGGRFIYALDATDPAVPKLLWRKASNGIVAGSDTGYSELGYTWSEPKVAKIKINVLGVPTDKTVLIFGGGYDPLIEDINPCLLEQSTATNIVIKAIGTGSIEYTSGGSCVINNATGTSTTRTRSMGRAIFVVDASDGSVIWQAGPAPVGATHNKTVAGMTCAIPSDITVIDVDREGHADRGYVGDTCGNVWRIDISDVDPANWGVFQIGAVSSTTATAIANKRKFLFPPDVVFSSDATGSYAAILLGSGDREHPFATNTTDRFYMFKDRTASGVFNTLASCTSAGVATDPITDSGLFDATATVGNNDCGFKLTLATGEKNIGAAVTIAGTTFFNTNQPSSVAGGGTCGSNLGIARQYLIGFEDASATTDLNATGVLNIANRSSVHAGGGFLPSPVPAMVDLSGKTYQVVISGTSVKTPAGASLNSRSRTYWYKEFD